MKTLKHHTIIYDDECPMCDLYTRAFTTSGMLSTNARIPFSKVNVELFQNIDLEKACDEIALFNTQTGETIYGFNSLTTIIGNSFPVFKPVFDLMAFQWIMKKFYAFISLNRKVIIPGKNFENDKSCTPSFSLKYRIAYIISSWILSTIILNAYTSHTNTLFPTESLIKVFYFFGGQILFQSMILLFIKRDRIVHYLGNMMTISLAGNLLLLIGLIFSIESHLFYQAWFIIVVALMITEHVRRLIILEIHWVASITWVLSNVLLFRIN